MAKTVCMVFPLKKCSDPKITIKLCDQELPLMPNTKFLGVWLDRNLDWNKHYSVICSKLKKNTGLLRRCKNTLTPATLRSIYFAHIHSHLRLLNSSMGQYLQSQCYKRATENAECMY